MSSSIENEVEKTVNMNKTCFDDTDDKINNNLKDDVTDDKNDGGDNELNLNIKATEQLTKNDDDNEKSSFSLNADINNEKNGVKNFHDEDDLPDNEISDNHKDNVNCIKENDVSDNKNLNQSENEESNLNQSEKKIMHTHYNPFGDTDDEDDNDDENNEFSIEAIKDKIKYPVDLNPFGDEEEDDDDDENDDEDEEKSVKSNQHQSFIKGTNRSDAAVNDTRRQSKSLNPFGSDDDDDDEEDVKNKNLNLIESPKTSTPTPAPRRSLQRLKPIPAPVFSSRDCYSTSSLERKKPNVPPRPPPPAVSLTDVDQSLNSSFSAMTVKSSADTSNIKRPAKKRAAPKPPGPPSSVNNSNNNITIDDTSSLASETFSTKDFSDVNIAPLTPDNSRRKLSFENRRDSFSPACSLVISEPASECESLNNSSSTPITKETSDTPSPAQRRKKKKQPAPPIPIPKRRIVTRSFNEIQDELNSIGDRLLVNDTRTKEIVNTMIKDGEKRKHKKLMYEYLILAQEKCSLARKQEELMYMKREHKLEEEHSEIEFKLRIIMAKPETLKSKDDDENEKELLQRLLEIIEERNDIVENIMKIDKRPDFFALVEKLKEIKSATLVQPILNSFMKISYNENQVKVTYTKKKNNKSNNQKEKKLVKEKKKNKKKSNDDDVKQVTKNSNAKQIICTNEENLNNENNNLSNKTDKLSAFKTLKRIAKVL